jgi:hypothetical protein
MTRISVKSLFPITLLSVAALLCGCVGSTMDTARSAAPSKTLSSLKPAQRVAECVEFTWQGEAMFGIEANAYLRRGADGRLTVYTREAAYFVDIRTQGTGTALAFYAPAGASDMTDRRLAALATCL